MSTELTLHKLPLLRVSFALSHLGSLILTINDRSPFIIISSLVYRVVAILVFFP